MARARDTGIPTLNAARRSFYAASNNSALAPYESWADFGFSIKHPESLNNFIAAYGTHPSIIAATTMVAKRAAADAILAGPAGADGILVDDPDTPVDETADNGPADSYAFLNSAHHEVTDPDTGITTVGALRLGHHRAHQHRCGPHRPVGRWARREAVRLRRPARLNVQLRLRGADGGPAVRRPVLLPVPHRRSEHADPARGQLVLRADPAQHRRRGPAGRLVLAARVHLRPGQPGHAPVPSATTPRRPYNESALLTRMPNGTIRYGGPEHVVFNGTAGNNRVWSSEGDDTIRGNDGNDWMQGGDGNDNHIGGLGDDILLDTNGDDTLKGGDGNDTLSSGQGFAGDLNQGGRGNDFIDHDDMAEAFAGPGDDWFLGGPEDDTVFGDDGDDWLENGATVTGTGGGAFNLLQGDNGAPFQDDPNEPGHDVLIGYGGETDYDSRGRRRRHAPRSRHPAQRGHARVRLRHARLRPRGSGLRHGPHGPAAAERGDQQGPVRPRRGAVRVEPQRHPSG